MIKIKLIKANSKWGKRMDKIIPPKLIKIYTKSLFESLTNNKVIVK